MKRLLLIIFSLIGFASCVQNKKYVFLQKDDVNKKGIVTDSVVRVYDFSATEYKVQPEDILSVRFESLTTKEYDFFSSDEALGNQAVSQNSNPLMIGELVDPEGMIPFPVIGRVKVAGLTVFQVQDTLQKIANQYLESPVVKVRLLNFRVTFIGEVKHEGVITFYNNRVSLLEAIGWAGSLTDLADKKNVKLIRQINGRTEVQYIDLLDENFINSPYYYVHQNDLIVVPALRQRPYRKYAAENLALIVSTLSLVVLTLNLLK